MASLGSRPFLIEASNSTASVLLQNVTTSQVRPPFAAARCRCRAQPPDFNGGVREARYRRVAGHGALVGLRATGRSGSFEGEGDGVDGGEGVGEEALQASIDKSKRILAMQQDILQQIAERRKHVSSIKSSVVNIEEQDAFSYKGGSSFSNLDQSSNSGEFARRYNEDIFSDTSAQSTEADKSEISPVGVNGNFPAEQKKSGNSLQAEHSVAADGSGLFKQAFLEAVVSKIMPPFLTTSSNTYSVKAEKLEDLAEADIDSESVELDVAPEEENMEPPPLAGANVMNVIVAAAECVPWSKTGGLGDVVGALPKALARRGHRVMVVAPRYGNYAEPQDTGVHKSFIVNGQSMKGRGPVDDFFCVDLPDHYMDLFKLYDPIGGDHFNVFAAGLKTADRVVTVSHGYAWELKTSEGGWGLHGILNENSWKLQGIVNGIDTKEWNPELDVHLKSDGYTNYSLETLETGKGQCKAALQQELGLPVRGDVPIIGFIGRLDNQKGVDLIAKAIPWLAGQDVQLIMLGTGRPALEDMLRRFESQHHDKVRGWVGFSVKMAHRITAGADIILMPSRFEPCGLNQLYAMMYGTVPVVHAVGGLRDTVQQFDPYKETGLRWTFDRAEAGKLRDALGNCLNTYWNYKSSWEGLQKHGMTQDLSWDTAAERYEEVLVAAKYQW